MNEKQKEVLRTIIYAVETGGQVYGQKCYSDFTEAYTNSDIEHAITIGAGQWYAGEAKTLLKRIRVKNPELWDRLDGAGIKEDLETKDWNNYSVSEESQKAQCIIKLISTNVGIKCQDALMDDQMESYIQEAAELGVTDSTARCMCANFRHQGGPAAVKRILAKTPKPYTLEGLYKACQSDTGNQVGAYHNRQRFVYESLKKYFPREVEAIMTKTEKAIRQMEEWAADDTHGYDQIYRWGEKGDYDCSAAVIQAWQNAGVPVKSGGATYTGNMKSVLLRCGFKDVTSSVNRSTGYGLKRGDVLLNEAKHVAMHCGNGMEVEASINEKGTATHGQPGDQTGKEFLVRPYRNYPWDCVLRYKDSVTVKPDPTEQKRQTVAYSARITKDTKCYLGAGVSYGQSKLFPKLKKGALVDVMKYTEKDASGNKWYFVRIAHPTEGFVNEFIPAGFHKKIK